MVHILLFGVGVYLPCGVDQSSASTPHTDHVLPKTKKIHFLRPLEYCIGQTDGGGRRGIS